MKIRFTRFLSVRLLTTRSRWLVLAGLVTTLTASLAAVSPSTANAYVGLHSSLHPNQQGQQRTRAAANIYTISNDANGTETSYLAAVTAGNNTPAKLTDTALDSLQAVSNDGKMTVGTTGSDSGDDKLDYGPIGQKPVEVSVDSGHRILWATFSPDSHYLTYTTAAQEANDWILGIIDLTNNNRVEFTGNYGDTGNNGAGFSGAADVVGWSADDKKLYLRTYMPYSATGGFDTLAVLDLSAISLDKPGRQPLPKAVLLLKAGEHPLNYAFSLDGSKLALMFSDPTNPPQNYFNGLDSDVTPDPSSPVPSLPPNIVSVRDTATGSEIMSVKADKGQGFEYILEWSPDSQRVIFAGGIYNNTFSTVTPTLYLAEVASKQVNKASTVSDQAYTIESALACADAVYFVASKDNADNGTRTATLYSFPLSNMASRSELVSASFITLFTCIP